MYKFIDTNEVSEGNVLPSEALKINGEYIENLISGYRTLNVIGREALSPDVTSFATGVRDGSRLQGKRYPERIIVITYQLMAESNEAFREAYNQLGKILNVKEAELIFNDEQDKYFVGTPCIISDVNPGANSVIGKFEILCTDPFKYSVIEYEATSNAQDGSILIDYNGTYKAYPTLEAQFFKEEETSAPLTGNGDCGYVAFFNEDAKIIQLGDPGEVDIEQYEKSQTLTNQVFTNQTAWGTNAQALWGLNNGYTVDEKQLQTGSLNIAPAAFYTPYMPATEKELLKVRSEAEKPYINYKLVARATERTETSVKVSVTITASLADSKNYFGSKRGLKCSVQIGGEWYEVTIKKESDYWRGNSGHIAKISAVVKNIEATTTLLEDIKFKAERTDDLGKTGILDETKCADMPINEYEETIPVSYYLTPADYGTGVARWHGASITRTLPADKAGEVGAQYFTMSYAHKFRFGELTAGQALDTNRYGGFQMFLTSENGNLIAGIRLLKNASGKNATLEFYADGKIREKRTIQITNNLDTATEIENAKNYFNVTVKKSKDFITISGYGGGAFLYSCAGKSIDSVKAANLTFSFLAYSDEKPMPYNGLQFVRFVKNYCDTEKDIPNKFSTGDILEADCKDGSILLNGISSPSLGALGNDWEDFYLTPGLNQIGTAFSDWTEEAPQFKVRYREVFI